jgi:hypothetical protein
MSKTHLTATITMAARPVSAADYSDKLVSPPVKALIS